MAVECCAALRDFLAALPAPEPEGFIKAREHVADFLPSV